MPSRSLLGELVELLRLILLTTTFITYFIFFILFYTLGEKKYRRRRDRWAERARFIEP